MLQEYSAFSFVRVQGTFFSLFFFGGGRTPSEVACLKNPPSRFLPRPNGAAWLATTEAKRAHFQAAPLGLGRALGGEASRTRPLLTELVPADPSKFVKKDYLTQRVSFVYGELSLCKSKP
jgi:hypothetical protein